MTSETRLKQWDYNMNKTLNFISFSNLSPVHTSKFIFKQSLPNQVTTCLSFLKISKLIFSAKYFESYFNLKLGHFYWDTLYSKWSCKLNKILYICFRKRRVRDKPHPYTREIRGLLKAKRNLKKKVRNFES